MKTRRCISLFAFLTGMLILLAAAGSASAMEITLDEYHAPSEGILGPGEDGTIFGNIAESPTQQPTAQPTVKPTPEPLSIAMALISEACTGKATAPSSWAFTAERIWAPTV